MGLFDAILSQVSEHADVGNLSAKLGLDPADVEKAIAALGIAHQQPGNTAQLAAGKTGLDVATIQKIIEAIGGEGSLSRFADEISGNPSILDGMFERDGGGGFLDNVTRAAKGLFGKR